MRRHDRKIENLEDILDVLGRCDVVRLGINTPDYPYIVPMSFGIEHTDRSLADKSLIMWFHCAFEGLKLDMIKRDPRVGFEADCSHRLIAGDKPCQFGMEYESVIGCGNISMCDDAASKRHGLKVITNHYSPQSDTRFSDSELASVCVLRLDITQITGKQATRHTLH